MPASHESKAWYVPGSVLMTFYDSVYLILTTAL